MAENGGMKKSNAVRALRRRIEREREGAKPRRVRFSDEVRQEVLGLLARPEWSQERLAEALGVAPSMLYRWTRQSQPHVEGGVAKRARARLRRVQVVEPAQPESAGSLELELRSGAKVCGLTLEQVARLLEVGA